MAAYDYGMALSRGLVAPQKELRAEIKALAGKSFKSEDWWNKQLDRQIEDGITSTKTKEQFLKAGIFGRADYWVDTPTTGVLMNPYSGAKRTGGMFGNNRPVTRMTEFQEQKDLTVGQLKAIQTQSEDSAAKVKREARLSKNKTKRGMRGSGGLLGKSKEKDFGLSSGVKGLGSVGLGINKLKLG